MTDAEIEAVIERCGPGRGALIEAAYQHDTLWRNMAKLCGLSAAESQRALPFILRTFDEDGRRACEPEDAAPL